MSYINRTSQKWQNGLLLGNGLYGISAYGNLKNETITGNHVDAFLRSDQFDTVPYMADKLEEIREIIDTQGYKEALEVFESIAIERGYRGLTMSDYYHPVYTLKINQKNNINCEKSRRFYKFNERSGNVESEDLNIKYTLNSNKTVIELKSSTKRSMEFEFELYSIENIECEISDNGKEFTLVYFDGAKYLSSLEIETDGIVTEGCEVKDYTYATIVISVKAPTEDKFKKITASNSQLSLIEEKQTNNNEELMDETVLSVERIQEYYNYSKYYIESYSGYRIPNLQGIWGGDFSPAWSGDYTFDTNVQLAIGSFSSLGLFEAWDGFFDHMKVFYNDFEINAKKYFGVDGYFVPGHASRSGLQLHWNQEWPLVFWTSGAGWLAHFYQEYFDHTHDLDFLENTALPYFEKAIQFYLDYIQDGFKISPAYSAENGCGDTPTMDIMVIEELLENLHAAYDLLGRKPMDGLANLEEEIIPYPIKDGVLLEWNDHRTEENYSHRHFSHLYGVFQSRKIDKYSAEWEAAKNAFIKKLDAWLYSPETADTSSAHARMQIAMLAISFEMGSVFDDALESFFLNKSHFINFAGSHYDNGEVFNMDSNGAFPKIIHDAIVYQEKDGSLTISKVDSKYLKEGTLENIHLRDLMKIKSLRWNTDCVNLNLVSEKSKTITLNWNGVTSSHSLECGENYIELARSI